MNNSFLFLSNSSFKNSDTCEEVFVWHLLMNYKNSYSLEKLLKWAKKKRNNFIFTMLYLLREKQAEEKQLEISLLYTRVPKILMI